MGLGSCGKTVGGCYSNVGVRSEMKFVGQIHPKMLQTGIKKNNISY